MRRAIVLLGLILGGSVLAQESPNYKLQEHVFNAGGHPQGGVTLTSASFRISLDALGEGIASAPLTSSSFILDGGFCTGYPPAGEVDGLAFQDAISLGWNPESSVGTYNLYRDLLGNLPGLAYGICEQEGLDSETVSDTETPPVGEGYFYLVTAENRLAEEGPKGSDSSGTKRTGVTCP
jgi:hypothetical protein